MLMRWMAARWAMAGMVITEVHSLQQTTGSGYLGRAGSLFEIRGTSGLYDSLPALPTVNNRGVFAMRRSSSASIPNADARLITTTRSSINYILRHNNNFPFNEKELL